MPEEDLEKTVVLESLEELANENVLEENECKEEIENTEDLEVKPKKEKKKHFVKLKNWWNKLSKKKKIFVIILFIFLLIVIGIGIFFFLKSLHKEEVVEEKKEDVIIEQENYRYENGKLIFLNDKEEIGTYDCTHKDENLCYVVYYTEEDDFDIEKNKYEDNTSLLERTPIIHETFAFIHDNKKEDTTFKIYNIKEKKMLEEVYQVIKQADNETKKFILKNNTGNYGVVTFNEETIENVIPFVYDYLGFYKFLDNYYISTQQNRSIILNENGKNISKGIPGTVKGLNKNYIKTVDDLGKYTVYDYNGKSIFQNYDYIELYNDYVALINKNKLFLKFYDGAKLNEEEIGLLNTDYVKTNMYDKEKKLKETKESFEITEKNETISIQVKNEGKVKTTIINKLEGLRSKTLNYINYIAGKLYIYSDASKTNLLGVYSCNNKNTIKDENSTLNNCFLARDTSFENNEIEVPGNIGILPILNMKYAFISDNPDGVKEENKTVVLYDLQNNKSVSKYNKINTYLYTGREEVTHQSINDLQVVAKNKNNKFGIIKIGNNTISSYVPFQYEEIEKIGNYYSVKNERGYSLIEKENSSVQLNTPISGKIKNYSDEYITGVENNLYYVYTKEGRKLNNTGYTYIALYPTFFAGVKDNKLNLFLYEKPEDNFLEKEITLNINNYYGNDPLAFKISVYGKMYNVYVGTNANTYEMRASGYIPLGE